MKATNIQGLNGYEFQHPFDRSALTILRKTKGFTYVFQKISEFGIETFTRIKYTGSGLKLSENQVSEVYNLFLEACRRLDIADIPELYLIHEDVFSSTIGVDKPIVVLSNEIVDTFSDGELLFVMGHQLSYIKTESLLYQQIANSINALADAGSAGVINLLTKPVQMAIGTWEKMASYSADRCGLLCCQDLDVATTALIKLSGMPSKYFDEINIEAFRAQAEEFISFDINKYNKLVKFLMSINEDLPPYIIRASELFKWERSGDYQKILDRIPLVHTEDENKCSYCGNGVSPTDAYCKLCGNESVVTTEKANAPVAKFCKSCNHPNPGDALFCSECGTKF